jgi:hypothetical protein
MGFLYTLHKEIAKRLNMSLGQYRKLIRNEWWMTSQEAVQFKVADGLVNGLIYQYQEPQQPKSLFRWKHNYNSDMMMCGPTDDINDPCYGIYE